MLQETNRDTKTKLNNPKRERIDDGRAIGIKFLWNMSYVATLLHLGIRYGIARLGASAKENHQINRKVLHAYN